MAFILDKALEEILTLRKLEDDEGE